MKKTCLFQTLTQFIKSEKGKCLQNNFASSLKQDDQSILNQEDVLSPKLAFQGVWTLLSIKSSLKNALIAISFLIAKAL